MSRTREALLNAEAEHSARYLKKYDHIDIEQKLLLLNLGKEQLTNQNLSELRQSYNCINECIKQPLLALDISLDESFARKEEIKFVFLPVLSKRKRLVLELIDKKVTAASIEKIRSALKHLQNKRIRAEIEKPLSWLDRKNQILKKEYHSLTIDETERAMSTSGTKNILNISSE